MQQQEHRQGRINVRSGVKESSEGTDLGRNDQVTER